MASKPSIDDNFQQVLDKFSSRLTKKELEDFQFSSLKDVQVAVTAIQDEQGRRKSMMNLTRVQRFLEAMDQYGKVIEVFLNASSILCFVWGPMKFCLQVASLWAESFDTLLDAYRQLSENIPLLEQYHDLFKANPQMTKVLSVIYEDILEFHIVALRVFKQSTWRQLFRSVWKDFNARFQHILDDLCRHKALVESQASLIQLQETQVERSNVRNHFAMIEEDARKNRLLAVFNWLSAADAILDQETATETRREHPSTCKWILKERLISAWVDPGNNVVPMVWMNGMPGAGKTILASLIVEECLRLKSISVIYFYCNYQDDRRNTFLAVARTLLAQLLNQNQDLLPYLHDECISSGQVSLVSSQLCVELLETCLNTMGTTHIIIDGIDECDFKERKSMLSFFASLIEDDETPGRLRGLFVSQDENDIRKLLRAASILRLTGDHNNSDIESYATNWSLQIQQNFGLSKVTQEYIISVVCSGAEGMFLFAKLVLTNLDSQASLEDLYKELQPGTFPKGFEQAYSRIVIRIYKNSNVAERETAKRLLGWIVSAKRPLKWHEIQGAVSINIDEQLVDFDNRQLRKHVRDLCGSLVDIVPGDRVQLVHGTARSYLIQNDYVKICTEEYKLTMLCLRYLNFDCFDPDLPQETLESYLMKGYYAFQDYAVLHWVDHLEASLDYLQTDVPADPDDIGSAIIDFYDAYIPREVSGVGPPQELRDRFDRIKDVKYFEKLILLLSHTRKFRASEEQLIALGDLGDSISKSRSLLEDLSRQRSLTEDEKTRLERYYGLSWYKCPRHACFHFHEGFPDATRRDNHINRHEKPYCCAEPSCLRKYLGFSKEKDLKKHMAIDHPDPAAFAWRFPKEKKPPPKHTCTVCSKDFARGNNLRTHMRTHANDRPFQCSFCHKPFVRKHDCERHEANLHPQRKHMGLAGSSQKTATASESDVTGVDTPEPLEIVASDSISNSANLVEGQLCG